MLKEVGTGRAGEAVWHDRVSTRGGKQKTDGEE